MSTFTRLSAIKITNKKTNSFVTRKHRVYSLKNGTVNRRWLDLARIKIPATPFMSSSLEEFYKHNYLRYLINGDELRRLKELGERNLTNSSSPYGRENTIKEFLFKPIKTCFQAIIRRLG